MCNGTYRECDPILHSNLAHQLGYVRLGRAITDAQGVPISLLDRPSTSIFKTCVSRSVKATWSVGKIRRGELLSRAAAEFSSRCPARGALPQDCLPGKLHHSHH